jgi:hypothetical protein
MLKTVAEPKDHYTVSAVGVPKNYVQGSMPYKPCIQDDIFIFLTVE